MVGAACFSFPGRLVSPLQLALARLGKWHVGLILLMTSFSFLDVLAGPAVAPAGHCSTRYPSCSALPSQLTRHVPLCISSFLCCLGAGWDLLLGWLAGTRCSQGAATLLWVLPTALLPWAASPRHAASPSAEAQLQDGGDVICLLHRMCETEFIKNFH